MTRTDDVNDAIGLYDILVAWQAGRLPYRQALARTGMRSVTEVYEAAADSGVEIRTEMLATEERAAERAISILKDYWSSSTHVDESGHGR